MPARKGELSSFEIDRRWPHQVTLRSADCRGSNFGYIHYFCKDLSLARRHHNVMRNDEWHTIFYFADKAHAENSKTASAAKASTRRAVVAVVSGGSGKSRSRRFMDDDDAHRSAGFL